MKVIRLTLLAFTLALGGMTSAYAHDSVGFSISIGSPGYYVAPPVRYYPAPAVVYYEPPVVYHSYYGPPASVYYYDRPYHVRHDYRHDWHGYGGRHGHRRHGWDD